MAQPLDDKNNTTTDIIFTRITQLEELVAKQSVEIKRLKEECHDLTQVAASFAKVIELLRQAGLQTEENVIAGPLDSTANSILDNNETTIEYFDDTEIFGKAPSSVIEAADTAGAAILAGMLGGKRRLLVDVRDAELSNDKDTLVQFIELAILPVAAGLEGLKSKRNRLKIVFPTVAQLMDYRKTMALAAPEVVALSTLDFDPVEAHDNLVVLIAPRPSDTEGIEHMNRLLDPENEEDTIQQPVVVVNPHMVPVSGPAANFEVAYHLRLLSVQFTTGGAEREHVEDDSAATTTTTEDIIDAAMQHAHELNRSTVHGMTRAIVIRAYPNPWHVFVDTSPSTDADFEVAATFDEEPTSDQVNMAIVECIEGSEEEDEIVAQQMQQALETGQLDNISELLGRLGMDIFDDDDDFFFEDDDDDDEDDFWESEDSV